MRTEKQSFKKAGKLEEEKIAAAVGTVQLYSHVVVPSYLRLIQGYFRNEDLTF
jgi:hypothetical protein